MARSILVETLLSRSLAEVPHADENFEKQSLNTLAGHSHTHMLFVSAWPLCLTTYKYVEDKNDQSISRQPWHTSIYLFLHHPCPSLLPTCVCIVYLQWVGQPATQSVVQQPASPTASPQSPPCLLRSCSLTMPKPLRCSHYLQAWFLCTPS